MYPVGSWHAKQIAHAIGASPDTIARMLACEHEPCAHWIAALNNAMIAAGDYGFLIEVFGASSVAPMPRAELQAVRRALEIAQAAIKGAG